MELTLYSRPPYCILDADLPCKLLRVPTSIRYTLFYLLSVNCSGKLCGGGISVNLCTKGTPILVLPIGTFIQNLNRNSWTFDIFCRVRSCSYDATLAKSAFYCCHVRLPSFRLSVRPSILRLSVCMYQPRGHSQAFREI